MLQAWKLISLKILIFADVIISLYYAKKLKELQKGIEELFSTLQ